MSDDPLDIIAASYATLAETQQSLAQTQLRIEETQRFAIRVQTFALTLIGLSLLGAGVLVWQHLATRQESAALNQAVLNNTQIIQAETRAILERLRQ